MVWERVGPDRNADGRRTVEASGSRPCPKRVVDRRTPAAFTDKSKGNKNPSAELSELIRGRRRTRSQLMIGTETDEERGGLAGGASRTADPQAVYGTPPEWAGRAWVVVAELRREKRRTPASDSTASPNIKPREFGSGPRPWRAWTSASGTQRRSRSAGNSSRTAATSAGSISAVTVAGFAPADASVVPHGS